MTHWDEVWGFVWHMEQGNKLTPKELNELAWLLRKCEAQTSERAIQAYMDKVIARREGKKYKISDQEIMRRRMKNERALDR
jgi:hypothetical protein